jgi:hypothetical protein
MQMRLWRSRQLARLSLGLPLAVACSLLEPTSAEPALVIFYGDTARVSAPTFAAPGVGFQVSVPTFAGGCTRTIARTEVRISGNLAEIRPYNETRQAPACPDDLIILTHVVSLRFDQQGQATIRVIAGQRPFRGLGTRTGSAQLEHHLVVQ